MEMKGNVKRLATILLAVLVLFTSIGINPQEVSAATKKITLSKTSATLYVGESMTLKVKSVTGLSSKKVTFKSGKKSVAVVSGKGVITAKKAGTCKITVTSVANKKVKATFKLQVKAASKKSITLQSKGKSLAVGKTTTIKVKKVKGLSSKGVTFKSSDKSVATVTKKGVVKAKKKGTAIITVTSKTNKKVKTTFKVTVTGKTKTVKATSIDIVSSITLQNSTGTRLPYTVLPSNVSNKKVTATSSNTSVVMVTDVTSSDIGILSTGTGKATITVKSADGSVTKKIKVVVKKKITKVTKININCSGHIYGTGVPGRSLIILPMGATLNCNFKAYPSNATNTKLTYKISEATGAYATKVDGSSAQGRVTVAQDGTLTPVKVGNCTLTVSASDGSGVSRTCIVEVVKEPLMTVKEALAELKAHPKKEFDFYLKADEYKDVIAYQKENGLDVSEMSDEKNHNGFVECYAWIYNDKLCVGIY